MNQTEDSPLIAQKEEIRKLTSIAMTTIGNLLSVPFDDTTNGEYQEYLMKCSSIIKVWMTDEIEARPITTLLTKQPSFKSRSTPKGVTPSDFKT